MPERQYSNDTLVLYSLENKHKSNPINSTTSAISRTKNPCSYRAFDTKKLRWLYCESAGCNKTLIKTTFDWTGLYEDRWLVAVYISDALGRSRLTKLFIVQVRQCTTYAVPVPTWLQDGADFGETGLYLELDACCVPLAQLRSRGKRLHQNRDGLSIQARRIEAQSLIIEAFEIDKRLTAWRKACPQAWNYTTKTVKANDRRSNSTLDGASTERNHLYYNCTISAYSNMEHALTLNRYRVARIVANSVAAKILIQCDGLLTWQEDPFVQWSLPTEFATQRQSALSNIQEFVNDICFSVPLHFAEPRFTASTMTTNEGDLMRDVEERTAPYKVYPLVWPLVVSLHSAGISIEQRLWLKAVLGIVGRITGNSTLDLAGTEVCFSDVDLSIRLKHPS